MKVQIYTKGLSADELSLVKSGLNKVKTFLPPLNFNYKTTETAFTSFPFSNDVASGYLLENKKLLDLVDGTDDIVCLFYDWNTVSPQPTNPSTTLIKKGNTIPMSIPKQWYSGAEDVFIQFFLHELSHAEAFRAGKKDLTHDFYSSNFVQVPGTGLRDYYLFLLKPLITPKPTTVSKVLKKGSKGPDVILIQQALGLKADGIFGANTEKAVKQFQKERGLVQDGIVGKLTFAEIVKKKTVSEVIDLTKWNLAPVLERKARQFLIICKADGYNLKITQGRRTQEEQNALYAQGRTKPGRVVTWTTKSKHIDGKAFDVAFTGSNPYPSDDKIWKAIADIGVSVGLKAGYYFSKNIDRPHFEI